MAINSAVMMAIAARNDKYWNIPAPGSENASPKYSKSEYNIGLV